MASSFAAQRQDAAVRQDDAPPLTRNPTASNNTTSKSPSAAPASSGAGKRTKRYAPKVRTGCLTCKKRRVKCDETKPKCLKCLNSDYQCDGYSVPKAWIFEPPAKVQSPESTGSTSSTSSEEEKELVLLQSPPMHTFTPDEARSMLFYLRRSGRIIAKYDHSKFGFWMDTLPKSAHSYDSVKHVLVATGLLDESLTSPTTIPKIERRIAYHYQQALSKTVHSKPSIDQILLNCMAMFYFDSLRDNQDLVVLHIESARKIIDEWRMKDEKATPDLHDLINAVDGIVLEARSYARTTPNPSVVDVDWQAPPAPDPYESAEDAEHALIACMGNLCRGIGQGEFALIRANVFLSSWRVDSHNCIKHADADTTLNLAALFQIAKDTIYLLDQSSLESQNERWMQLLNSLQEMPKLRSAKYRKPVTALIGLLEDRSETKEQTDAIKALQKHLQRGLVYDG